MDTMIPITAEDLANIPRARATRISYNWSGRYSVWIASMPFSGWSIVTDYGKPGDECVVTSPRNRDDCISALADYVRDYGEEWKGYGFSVDEWEFVSIKHDAWITQTQALGSRWAPLPQNLR